MYFRKALKKIFAKCPKNLRRFIFARNEDRVQSKKLPHIKKYDTAKETWDALETRFLRNDSMKRNRYDELSNEAEGFYMRDDESHEDMFRRLNIIANDFKKVGAEYIDDAWIKRK